MRAVEYLLCELIDDLYRHTEGIVCAPTQQAQRCRGKGGLSVILFSAEARYVVELSPDSLKVLRDANVIFEGDDSIESFEVVRGRILNLEGFDWKYVRAKRTRTRKAMAGIQ